ncbi:ribosomal protein L1-like protein [Halteromyces radiatus]|uniref:ribosomal protein L1-like protein n=1 Tax=Halteromyces radiatus TaxID=101107 RepID=UPI00221EFC30|nr:ribosomal protein L1-like protein [Halteromyces radiatus]KAI8093379.1 ribosomal protein L1-like protein [Halteromyces radiatus]
MLSTCLHRVARSSTQRVAIQQCYYATKKSTAKVNPDAVDVHQALKVLKAMEVGHPSHQIEAHIQCKIEKSTPLIRGSLVLPKSIKQEATIVVFATGKKAEEARAAGAQYVGGEELIEQVQKGEIKFDKCISTPQMFPAVTKIARVLGPKGLMPTVKKGTVTDDVSDIVRKSKSSFDFKGDKFGVLHTGIGKVEFESNDIENNLKAILEELRLFGKANNLKAFIQNVSLSSTRGPGIAIANGAALQLVGTRPTVYNTTRCLSTSQMANSSHGLLRLKEYYDSTLAEDLMILGYDHSRVAPPTTKYPDLEVQIDRALQSTGEEQQKKQETPYVARTRKGGKPVKPIAPLKSANAIPKLDKITLHAMIKDAIGNKSNLLSAFMAFQSITGTRPEVVYARTSVANWKLREGMPIGVKVTLRGEEMYQFMDKLVEIVLPRLKEWPGMSMTAGDGNGNVAIGFPPSALALFPEIEGSFDVYPKMTGFDVTFNTTAYTNTDGRLLLSGFSVPFKTK